MQEETVFCSQHKIGKISRQSSCETIRRLGLKKRPLDAVVVVITAENSKVHRKKGKALVFPFRNIFPQYDNIFTC